MLLNIAMSIFCRQMLQKSPGLNDSPRHEITIPLSHSLDFEGCAHIKRVKTPISETCECPLRLFLAPLLLFRCLGVFDPHCDLASDNGRGVPAENLSKIYGPFFANKEVGRSTGQGLANSCCALHTVARRRGYLRPLPVRAAVRPRPMNTPPLTKRSQRK